jgi:hypothetical protein
MLIPMLHLSMISEIMHMREVVALLDPFLLWPQASICKILTMLKIFYRNIAGALESVGQTNNVVVQSV